MNARERLQVMIRTNRGNMTVWSPSEIREALDAYRDDVRREVLGDDLNPSSLVLDAQAYGLLRDAITATMADPDRWDGDESEVAILCRYVQWLADGKPPRDGEGDSGQPAADESAQAEPISVRWDRTVIHPDAPNGFPTGETIVCCLAETDKRPVALFLDDEHREALGLLLVDPNGQMDQADDGQAAPDFFQPGRTYTDGNGFRAPEVTAYFRVEHVTRHPDRGTRRAIGWMRSGAPGAGWHGDFRDECEFKGWTEVTEAGEAL